jgi:2,4-dienoyl-CoA reductase (NADPH2)
VSAARPLVANNDLVKHFAAGRDRAPKPCTYCNKCLAHVVEHPLGCYEESRFTSRDEMMAQIMSVFHPPAFA